jgi:two-component system sensor histidine kinase DesK
MVALKSEIASKLLEVDPERAKQEILEINQASRSALKNVRAAVTGIISTTLIREIENAEIALNAAKVSFSIVGDVPNLSIDKDKAAGLAIREAVTNVVRHSNATAVTLTFSQDSSNHTLIFEDNGNKIGETEGSGLAGLKRRIASIGGETMIDMLNGVKIEAKLPVEQD